MTSQSRKERLDMGFFRQNDCYAHGGRHMTQPFYVEVRLYCIVFKFIAFCSLNLQSLACIFAITCSLSCYLYFICTFHNICCMYTRIIPCATASRASNATGLIHLCHGPIGTCNLQNQGSRACVLPTFFGMPSEIPPKEK